MTQLRLRELACRFPLSPVLFGMAIFAAVACNRDDVGAPCNHGQVEPPESKLVTFPALTCNELICVYADEEEPKAGGCDNDPDCNVDPTVLRFECASTSLGKRCQLRTDYVLERSMCSKKCSSDSDCRNDGPLNQNVVDDTECQNGFSCARIQGLGQFCCQKLCICNDDLAVASVMELNAKCSSGEQNGCCRDAKGPITPSPEGCNVP